MRIGLPGLYPVVLTHSGAGHWQRNGTQHGRQSTPRLLALKLVRLSVEAPSTGLRLWVYLRRGYAWCADLYVDRRAVPT